MKSKSLITLIFCLLSLTFTFCSKENSQTSDLPVYHAVFTDQIKLSDHFSSLEYVFLEDNPEGYFISADKIIFYKHNWYLLDKDLMAVLCYGESGKFKFKIQNVGKGPGEYQLLSSFFINPDKDELWLHCRMSRKHLVYSLDGVFMREQKCSRGCYDLEPLNNGEILAFNADKHYFGRDSLPPGLFISTEDIYDSKQLFETKTKSEYFTMSSKRYFSVFNDTIFFMSQSDSLVAIDKKGHVKVYGIFDFGDFHLPETEKSISFNPYNPDRLSKSGKVIWKDQPLATKNLFFFQLGLNNSIWYGIIDRTKHTLYCTQGISNDINHMPFIFPTGMKSENEVVGLLSADYIYAYHESLSKIPDDQKQNPEFKQLNDFINQALEGSGYVLVIAKLKQ